MAVINKKELKSLTPEDLNNKMLELRKELMKQNAQIAIGTIPKSPGLVKGTKKAIAKIKTLLREKEINKKPEELKKNE
jgi:large subunit ribosomal protein L29